MDTFFHGAAPELVNPQRFGLIDTGTTKASDMYAFGVLAWEVSPTFNVLWSMYSTIGALSKVFAGQAPFSDEGAVAGIYSMSSGRRPPRPNHPELSDRVWEMIEGCWESEPARRRTITEVVVALNAELNPR